MLPDDLAHLKSFGIDTLISLLEPSEAAEIGLNGEAEECSNLGMSFLNHPIRDMHLPDPEPFTRFAVDVAHQIRSDHHIAVHCHASIGRSGMLACTVLGHFGFTAAEALRHVSEKRGATVPDTKQQAAFIQQVIRALET